MTRDGLKRKRKNSLLCSLGHGLQTTLQRQKAKLTLICIKMKGFVCKSEKNSFSTYRTGAQCPRVNIWKLLRARSLFEKQQILEQMPARYRREDVRTRAPGISYSRMFKKSDGTFPCQKQKEKERERGREKRTFK